MSPAWPLIAAHRDRLVRLAGRRLPTVADAEDCAHEAMLRCLAVDDLDQERIGPLLTSITKRLCADWHRHHEAGHRAMLAFGGRRPIQPDPFSDVDDRAEAQWLASHLAGLGDTERAVLLARVEGWTVEETARTLGITYRAAACCYNRARHKLRAALGVEAPRATARVPSRVEAGSACDRSRDETRALAVRCATDRAALLLDGERRRVAGKQGRENRSRRP